MTDSELIEIAKINKYKPEPTLINFAQLAIRAARIDVLRDQAENIREAVRKEREACAKLAEAYEPRCDTCPSGVANAIRARG